MIKTSFLVVFTGLIFITGLSAQENRKEWSDGKLNWQDFPEWVNAAGISELKYYIGYNADKQRFGDTTVLRYFAKGYMDKSLSWIHPDFKTEQYLRYNQVIFDIIEIHRRKLQYELDRVYSFFEIESKLNPIFNDCNHEIENFKNESNGGGNLNTVLYWEQKTSKELDLYPNYNIPEFENRNFGYALHAGIGAGIFTGTLGKHFSPLFSIIFGFDIAYKNSILFLNGTLAIDKVKSDYLSDLNWYKSQHVNVAIVDISYGYAVVDNSNIKVSPFAGLGITEFSRNNEDDNENKITMADYNLIFGLNADYKIRTRFNFFTNSYIGGKEKVVTSVRARLYIAGANYSGDLKGYSVNLTIGLSGFGNMIRLK